MKRILIAATVLVAGSALLSQAHAQKEAIGMFYELQMAPKVCKWTDAPSSAKLDATIAAQEKALGVSSSDKADLMKQAEADLRSDPSNCDKDGMLRPMYDEAVK
jgi:hypothetical protein